MTSADPYLRFVEAVIDALEELINSERHPVVDEFAHQLDDTIAAILDFHKRGDR
jgi:cell fate (sporulation/competence/biofilm development) regulator YmcA (YheA/YmcA/DUF963 family)